MATHKSILIFGTGQLQQSLIERCKLKGLYTVGIDPNPDAVCKNNVDAFEIVAGDDFDMTIAVARRYNISGLITSATDKPLVMMARVAEKLNLPFFSVETAENSTDKLLMKQKFIEAGLPCAKGYVICNVSELVELNITFPAIIKPRDNSGSRGVIYCDNIESAAKALKEAFNYTKKGNVLIEEFIEGQEYSVEGIHYNGEHYVIQITEKTTTDFPYNVEIAHVQPAKISIQQFEQVRGLINQIAQKLGYKYCSSHTEIKINSRGIFIIETSPRLGGDYISSTLVPLSTGFNMEEALIDISINNDAYYRRTNFSYQGFSSVLFFQLPAGVIKKIGNIEITKQLKGCLSCKFDLKEGETIPIIKNSIDRYGYAIFQANNNDTLIKNMMKCKEIIENEVLIEKN